MAGGRRRSTPSVAPAARFGLGGDILVFEDGGVWTVEVRDGGADGKSRWFELPTDDVALDCVRDLITLSKVEGWRELPKV